MKHSRLRGLLLIIVFSFVFSFAFYANGYSLKKPAAQTIPITKWLYRQGDCAKNKAKVPIWILEKNSTKWVKNNLNNLSFMFNLNGDILKNTTAWFKVQLPQEKFANPVIYFEKIYGQKIEFYVDSKKIHKLKRTPWTVINKQIINLPQNYSGKTLYIKITIPEVYQHFIGPKNQILVGDFNYLMAVYIRANLTEISFSVILVFVGIMIILITFFLLKEQQQNWLALGLLILNSSVMLMFNNNDLNMFFGDLSQHTRELIENINTFLFEASRFTFTSFLIYFFIQIFSTKHNINYLKKILFWQNIYSGFCFVLLLAFIISGFKFTTIYILFAYAFLAILYSGEFCLLIVITIFYAYKKDTNARILLFGFFAFIITFGTFFIILTSYNLTVGGIVWIIGSTIFILSLVTILGRNIAENHSKVIKYAKDIEYSKNQLADLNKTLELRVKERTEDLSKTLKDLQKAQSYLIESEKMAALGQLVTSIAHEINTPIGAIHSSINNIAIFYKKAFDDLPKFSKIFNPDQKNLFFALIGHSIKNNEHLTCMEELKLKEQLFSQLLQDSIENPEEVVDILVDIGVYSNLDQYKLILKDKNNSFILKIIYNIAGIYRNSKNISVATNKVSRLLFALKSYTHNDSDKKFVKTDLKKNIENVLTLYYNKSKYDVNIIKNYSAIPKILCNPDELNQVWSNIINNALQAMNYKGKLEIKIFQKENNVIIQFIDDGIGIPDKIKEKIFLPFFTTKPQGEGTGLGLDIVKKIITNHSGDIKFESITGQTIFNVVLPII